MTLRYWDWTAAATLGGIAPAHADAQFDDAGTTRRNSLRAGPIENGSRLTRRAAPQNQPMQRLQSIAQSAYLAMNRSSFRSFSSASEGAHNGVHEWVVAGHGQHRARIF